MVRVIVVALGALAAACIEPDLQPCGDKLCAADAVCLSNGQCATRDDVDACTGLVDGDVCHTTLFDGICTLGACAAPRCGDGVITEGAEQCDGSVNDHDCVEFGFDLGIPACNDRCDIDVINSCVRFGWTRLVPEAVDSMWTNGGDGIAFVRLDGTVEVRWTAGTFTDPDAWYAVEGNATTVYAVNGERVIRSTGGAWEEMLPPPIDPDLRAVSADGTLYIARMSACNVHELSGGVWTEILDSPSDCSDLETTSSGIVVGFDTGEVQRYRTGSGWTPEVAASGVAVLAVLEHDSVLYYSTITGSLYGMQGSQTFTIVDDFAVELVSAGPFVLFDDSQGRYGRIDDGIVERVGAPTFGEIYADPMGGVYVYNNGIHRLSPFEFAIHQGISEVTTDMALTTESGIPVIATMQQLLFIHNNNDTWDEYSTPDTVTAIGGHHADELYVASAGDLWRFDGALFTDQGAPPAFTGVRDLWVDPKLDLVHAVGDSSLIITYDRTANTWSTETAPSPGCDLAAITGNATTLYVVGDCAGTGIVWTKTQATWSEVYRAGPPLAAVTLTSDGEVFAAGPSGGARTRNGVWGDEPSAQGIAISATTATDVFVGGGPAEMINWDGTVWSRMRLTGAISPRVIATPHAVYIGGASQGVLLR